MKALLYYGKNDIRLENIQEPVARPGEVKIKVSYAGICGTDYEEYLYGPLWVSKDSPHPLTGKKAPLVLGHEFSGRVAEVGEGVKRVAIGDRVAVYPILYCGECRNCRQGYYYLCSRIGCIGLSCDGGFEEYCVVPERNVYRIPDELSEEHAAMAEPTGFCINAVGSTGISLGDDVAVFGAGGIGLICLQLARAAGCRRVFMIGRRRLRLETARKLGADEIIDEAQGNYREKIMELTDGQGVDCVIEATGSEKAVQQAFQVVKSGGKVTLAGVFTKNVEFDFKCIVNYGRRIAGAVGHNPNHFETALKMLTDGRVNVAPIITKIVKLESIIEEGFKQYLMNKGEHVKILVNP